LLKKLEFYGIEGKFKLLIRSINQWKCLLQYNKFLNYIEEMFISSFFLLHKWILSAKLIIRG
jgi:hypothetical protein